MGLMSFFIILGLLFLIKRAPFVLAIIALILLIQFCS